VLLFDSLYTPIYSTVNEFLSIENSALVRSSFASS
jgi:hypothetical protein